MIAGGSVAGAKALVSGSVDVAVNFCGGWHHAQRDFAAGFCYINDCTIILYFYNEKHEVKLLDFQVFLPF